MNDNVTIKYDETQSAPIPKGNTLKEALTKLPMRSPQPVAAIVNGRLEDLDCPLEHDSNIIWLDYKIPDGHRIYKRSLIFVLILATKRILPQHQLYVSHSLENGSYCELIGEEPITDEYIAKIEKEMQKIVADDLPITSKQLNKKEAAEFLRSQNKKEKAELVLKQSRDNIKIYTLAEISDFLFGIMATHTGILNNFHLIPFDEGFVLRLPAAKDIGFSAGPFTEPRHLQAVLREYDNFCRLLGVRTIAELNNIIKEKGIEELSLIGETMQERSLHKIADNIMEDYPTVKIILIAGPSCSGKTTFTHKLAIQFRTLGIQPIIISLDNYFINRDDTPLDEYGEKDFESINALDLPLFNSHLLALLKGEEVHTPQYDFASGSRKKETISCSLKGQKIILIEGIHGLNEKLTAAIPKRNKRKIYVSALTQLNMDEYTPIPSSDNRLLRRIVRDMQFRSHDAEKTIMIWNSVRRGEFKNIFPYQENADYYFNSALIHEFSILRSLLEPALKAINTQSEAYPVAERLSQFIEFFTPVDPKKIPCDSILQEFLGYSCDPFK